MDLLGSGVGWRVVACCFDADHGNHPCGDHHAAGVGNFVGHGWGRFGVPAQPAMQPYLGRVGLVVTRRVPGSAAVEFCEWTAPLVQPLYTLRNPCQPSNASASPTDRATPAMPPAAWTASSHCCCSGRSLPVAVLTSMLVNTATVLPTISGVTVTRFHPIRSALPLQSPKETGLPCWSLSVPVLLRNNRVSPLLQAILISCWIRCSLT
jgi:hypothetical protein